MALQLADEHPCAPWYDVVEHVHHAVGDEAVGLYDHCLVVDGDSSDGVGGAFGGHGRPEHGVDIDATAAEFDGVVYAASQVISCDVVAKAVG